jgi:hypothetical protein
MNFSLVPLLLTGKSISAAARQALHENRFDEEAAIIMAEFGLSCNETSDLLSVAVCD